MQQRQRQFIAFALQINALQFGDFTLKSGIKSPYFFNAGAFCTGQALSTLGALYAETTQAANCQFDVVFGPAYKGIPLACATAQALAELTGRAIPYCFNRKEIKDHGEGGQIVGAPLTGRVLLVDDVITRGTAIKESLPLLAAEGGTLAGIVVMLDREEKQANGLSAIDTLCKDLQVPVISLIQLSDILTYLQTDSLHQAMLPILETYYDTHCQ